MSISTSLLNRLTFRWLDYIVQTLRFPTESSPFFTDAVKYIWFSARLTLHFNNLKSRWCFSVAYSSLQQPFSLFGVSERLTLHFNSLSVYLVFQRGLLFTSTAFQSIWCFRAAYSSLQQPFSLFGVSARPTLHFNSLSVYLVFQIGLLFTSTAFQSIWCFSAAYSSLQQPFSLFGVSDRLALHFNSLQLTVLSPHNLPHEIREGSPSSTVKVTGITASL